MDVIRAWLSSTAWCERRARGRDHSAHQQPEEVRVRRAPAHGGYGLRHSPCAPCNLT